MPIPIGSNRSAASLWNESEDWIGNYVSRILNYECARRTGTNIRASRGALHEPKWVDRLRFVFQIRAHTSCQRKKKFTAHGSNYQLPEHNGAENECRRVPTIQLSWYPQHFYISCSARMHKIPINPLNCSSLLLLLPLPEWLLSYVQAIGNEHLVHNRYTLFRSGAGQAKKYCRVRCVRHRIKIKSFDGACFPLSLAFCSSLFN